MSDFMQEIDKDDWCQRLKENPPEPLEEIRQEHEAFLTKLEALAVQAIATNDWNDFYQHLIEFQSEHDLHGITGIAIGDSELETITKDLHRPGDGSLSHPQN